MNYINDKKKYSSFSQDNKSQEYSIEEEFLDDLIVKNLSKRYKNFKVLQNINERFKAGRISCILGHNGAGKSTLLKIMAGLLSRSSGDIIYKGIKNYVENRKFRMKIGIVSTENLLEEDFTVYEQIKIICYIKNIESKNIKINQQKSENNKEYFYGENMQKQSQNKEKLIYVDNKKLNESSNTYLMSDQEFERIPKEKNFMDKKIKEILKKYKLLEYKNEKIKHLSEGTKKKLMIVMSLINKPQLLFLDEPTSVIDTINRREIWKCLKTYIKENPKAIIIMCTHLLEEAEQIGDDIFFLSKGQIVVAEELCNLKKIFGIGYSIKLYKRNKDSDIELSIVEDYVNKINKKLFNGKLKIKYYKTFLRIIVSSHFKHLTKHLMRSLELFFNKDFIIYLNSTNLEDVYFNISDMLKDINRKSIKEDLNNNKKDLLQPNISAISNTLNVHNKNDLLDMSLFDEESKITNPSILYSLSAIRLTFIIKNKTQMMRYFSTVLIHLVNFYFGNVFFTQNVFLYYVISFFLIDVYFGCHAYLNAKYNQNKKIKNFIFRKGVSPWKYYLSNFFIESLLISFEFIIFFTEISIFFQDLQIKSRNLTFLLIGLYFWKLQCLVIGTFFSLTSLTTSRIYLFYYLGLIAFYVLIFFFNELFGFLPHFLIIFFDISFISTIIFIRINDAYFSFDNLIFKDLPYQIICILFYFGLCLIIEYKNLKYNYHSKKSKNIEESEPEKPLSTDNLYSNKIKSISEENESSEDELYESYDEEKNKGTFYKNSLNYFSKNAFSFSNFRRIFFNHKSKIIFKS